MFSHSYVMHAQFLVLLHVTLLSKYFPICRSLCNYPLRGRLQTSNLHPPQRGLLTQLGGALKFTPQVYLWETQP